MKTVPYMKQRKLLIALLVLLFGSGNVLFSQNVAITDNGNPPNSSAMLDVQSNATPYRGFLMPRLTLANKTAISSPATGLLVYQTDGTTGFWYYDGATWKQVGKVGWELTGNAGTTAGTNFLGTTDAVDFVIKTSNTERLRVLSTGNVGIGITNPSQPLTINGNSLTIGTHYLNNTNTALSQGSGNALKITTNSGWTEIGAENTSWSHFYTDRSRYYFDASITVDEGNIGSYDENLSLQTSGTTRMTISNTTGNVGINTTSPNSSALLDVTATNKGVLLPQVALTGTTDATTIVTPATSLLVYNTGNAGTPPYDVTKGYYYNAGTPAFPNWVSVGTKGSKFTVHYDNRFRVSSGTYSYYFYNSQNYGPATEGDNDYPYRNDYQSGYYVTDPTLIPALMGIWQSTVCITSPCYLSKFSGWAMVENMYNKAVGTAVSNPSTITVSIYKYTPTNGGTGNVTGTLIASGSTATLTYSYYTYNISFVPSSQILLNPGDFLVAYVKSSSYPYVSSTSYYSFQTLIGEMEFTGQ
jgi:hypothetical protein